MHQVKVLGSGSGPCRRLEALLMKLSEESNLNIDLEFVTDFEEIIDLGVTATPGLVVDGTVVSVGRIPTEAEIVGWLKD